MSQSAAEDIVITVKTQFLADHPVCDEGKFAFAYFITIKNTSKQSVQLLNRYWLITDGNGKTSEVQGAGVVGEQPHISPNQAHHYNSGAILDTPVGTMQGFYEMQRADGSTFEAPIPLFSLAVTSLVN
ncbi:Co2+/Mg2+ efflux protein ApaG [Neptunicella marina]|uniref:Protein ApaG n=1 Tax=Neptunicella marina TaxID=2125989 RepID=A0A8J6IT48_9ALTE|nr:Co2+/Mg2+ efflux protein ApaG [Neptunicella marina]